MYSRWFRRICHRGVFFLPYNYKDDNGCELWLTIMAVKMMYYVCISLSEKIMLLKVFTNVLKCATALTNTLVESMYPLLTCSIVFAIDKHNLKDKTRVMRKCWLFEWKSHWIMYVDKILMKRKSARFFNFFLITHDIFARLWRKMLISIIMRLANQKFTSRLHGNRHQ